MRATTIPRRPRHGVARVLSKRGVCSRTQAAALVRAGRVAVNGRVVIDPEFPVHADDVVVVDGGEPSVSRVYLMLNKPRGLVTTAADEKGRDTVYRCLDGAPGGWLAPVGRLDKASEGLLLFSNDPAWAAAISGPGTGPRKRYHVQVDGDPADAVLARLHAGIEDAGEHLRAASIAVLRRGQRTAWLDIELAGGRNRQIRRMLAACGLDVRRLIRVSVGDLMLGDLAKGAWRELEATEAAALAARSGD